MVQVAPVMRLAYSPNDIDQIILYVLLTEAPGSLTSKALVAHIREHFPGSLIKDNVQQFKDILQQKVGQHMGRLVLKSVYDPRRSENVAWNGPVAPQPIAIQNLPDDLNNLSLE